MAWFSRVTRFGDVHLVYGQESDVSCGVACAIMAAFKINKLRPGTKAVYDEKGILKLATKLFGPNPLKNAGLGNQSMRKLLNHADLKMKGWKYERLAKTDVTRKIIKHVGVDGGFGPTVDVKPMVVGIDWKGGGGHWVVVDTVRSFRGKLYATVCDPWDAHVHVTPITKGQPFKYTGREVVGLDFWGKRYNYDKPSVGEVFLGDILYREV